MQRPLSWMRSSVLLAPATAVIAIFVVVPFILIFTMSFASSTADGSTARYGLGNYHKLLSPLFLRQTAFSVALSLLVAGLALLTTVPFAYFLSGYSRKVATVILVLVLAQSSLSEVLISFSWQVLLARTTGLTNVFVYIGLLDQPFSLVPSFWAMLVALVYLAVPFAILILFPAFSRLDRSLVEAARTMGATPIKAFTGIVLPVCKPALVACGISVYILTLGSVIVPQLLGNPRDWTIAVHITDQALFQYNPPLAAALAVILLAISVVLLLAFWLVLKRNRDAHA
jgi:putative spermidine/putrescine transport system permease protein